MIRAILLCALLFPSLAHAVTLPFSTTFDCPESHGYSPVYGSGWQAGVGCDGFDRGGDNRCSPGELPSWISSDANMPGGGGGRGLKVYVGGPSRNNNSGGLALPLSQSYQQLWVRLYMKYPSGMRSTIGGEDWGHKILWIYGTENRANILEPDPSGIKVWNQGQTSQVLLDSGWSWNQIWGHATPGANLTADGQWHLWELYIKYDSGSHDGVQTVWIDNVQRLHQTGLNINTQGANRINIHTNQSGVEGGACVPIYFDDIAVSATGRIGPLGGTTYTVTPSAGANGSISPATPQTVNSGSTAAFTVTPNAGYTAAVGGTCGGNLVGATYTTNAVTANCTVSASFCKKLATPAGLNVASIIANPPSNVTISYGWNPVTTHADGSALNSDLSNYRLYWGPISGGSYNNASAENWIVSAPVGPTQANIYYYAKIGAESTLNAVCNSDLSQEVAFFADPNADTAPPVLSGLAPTGDQSAPVTSIALALTTDEAATCKYNLDGVSDYDLMTNYTSTGGTSHSATVTVLPGRVYAPAAKCRDAAGNTSASPAWRFAVPAPARRRLRH